jgi:glucose-6-phosphate isomerase
MLTKNIKFKNFLSKKIYSDKLNKILKKILKNDNKILSPLNPDFKYSYTKKQISKLKNYNLIKIIGMGGSILGTEAIYDFLKEKTKKKIVFLDNIELSKKKLDYKKKSLNIIISKSGNTLETIANTNIFLNEKNKNIFITENSNNYLRTLANKLKSEIIEHKNFIGGRYSVLSEVGMLPAELIGLNQKKFKQLNNLIKNKKFINQLINNVLGTLNFLKHQKYQSIILNYDLKSNKLFEWYQQLVAESLGKKSIGILPIISSMPKDNHSLMQFFLDGPKKSFFTFFYVHEKKTLKINNNKILGGYDYIKNKSLNSILYSQKQATEKVFNKKKIPFRSFEIFKRDEKTMGELFCFFILETILLGRALNVNPFDQPSVELIKKETKKILQGF